MFQFPNFPVEFGFHCKTNWFLWSYNNKIKTINKSRSALSHCNSTNQIFAWQRPTKAIPTTMEIFFRCHIRNNNKEIYSSLSNFKSIYNTIKMIFMVVSCGYVNIVGFIFLSFNNSKCIFKDGHINIAEIFRNGNYGIAIHCQVIWAK